MKTIIKNAGIGGIGAVMLIFARVASASTEPTNILTSTTDVVNVFCGALTWVYWGLIVVSIIMFLWGGYIFATSSGDAEQVSKARKILIYAAIAVVVALIAPGIPYLLGSFLGVSANQLKACGS